MDGRSAVNVRGAGTEFDSLREYVVGDDVRSIDWRSSARRGEVLVRTWRPERDRRVLVLIDTGRLAAARLGDEPRLDAQIEACLLLSALASRAGDRIDVVARDERVRAQVRRASGEATEDELTAGQVRVDVAAHRAFVGSRELQLTTREFELLRVLVRGAGAVVRNEDILKEVWGEDPTGTQQTLQMHVTWLRRKLGDDVDAPSLLLAVDDGHRIAV